MNEHTNGNASEMQEHRVLRYADKLRHYDARHPVSRILNSAGSWWGNDNSDTPSFLLALVSGLLGSVLLAVSGLCQVSRFAQWEAHKREAHKDLQVLVHGCSGNPLTL